ncbi:DUF3575 domain-containing protein [Lutimonas vermicola]|uniref:DUF3575 domain-containing protein n=1 Tax=Lutimonas vermicola TaxID=414288 RepID=A0ABU9L220_9FLAO
MKNEGFIIVIVLLTSMSVFAQKNILKGGFVASGGANLGLQYERSVSSRVSVLGQIGYAEIFDIIGMQSSTGLGMYVEGRYYFSTKKDLMEGWHGGIYCTYMNTHYNDGWFDYDQNNLGIGAVGGYQWVFSPRITVDTLFGGGYLRFDEENMVGDRGFYPLIGLNLGYNF